LSDSTKRWRTSNNSSVNGRIFYELGSPLPAASSQGAGPAIQDRDMVAMSTHPFAINSIPNLKEIALANGWKVYRPEANHAGR